MLCIDFPPMVTQGVLAILDKRDAENVEFDEFLKSVKTILLYDNFFEEMEPLFKHLDVLQTGKIQFRELVEACQKLEGETTDLRVPPANDIEYIYKRMTYMGQVDTPSMLSLAEYFTLLFRTTQEDAD